MDIINSIAYFIWGKWMVNYVYDRTWAIFRIDPTGFWICFAISIALLALVGFLAWNSVPGKEQGA